MGAADESIHFADATAFDRWLEAHDDEGGVWLRIAKAGSGIASLTSDEAVDVGLCHGWISGQRLGLDDSWYLQRYVPRRPRSRWSQVNVRKVEQLTEQGRMRPRGLLEVDAAKADGRWDAAYASQAEATTPDDLAAALARSPAAAAAYERRSRTARYVVIHALLTAESPAARERRLLRAIAVLERE